MADAAARMHRLCACSWGIKKRAAGRQLPSSAAPWAAPACQPPTPGFGARRSACVCLGWCAGQCTPPLGRRRRRVCSRSSSLSSPVPHVWHMSVYTTSPCLACGHHHHPLVTCPAFMAARVALPSTPLAPLVCACGMVLSAGAVSCVNPLAAPRSKNQEGYRQGYRRSQQQQRGGCHLSGGSRPAWQADQEYRVVGHVRSSAWA